MQKRMLDEHNNLVPLKVEKTDDEVNTEIAEKIADETREDPTTDWSKRKLLDYCEVAGVPVASHKSKLAILREIQKFESFLKEPQLPEINVEAEEE